MRAAIQRLEHKLNALKKAPAWEKPAKAEAALVEALETLGLIVDEIEAIKRGQHEAGETGKAG